MTTLITLWMVGNPAIWGLWLVIDDKVNAFMFVRWRKSDVCGEISVNIHFYLETMLQEGANKSFSTLNVNSHLLSAAPHKVGQGNLQSMWGELTPTSSMKNDQDSNLRPTGDKARALTTTPACYFAPPCINFFCILYFFRSYKRKLTVGVSFVGFSSALK